MKSDLKMKMSTETEHAYNEKHVSKQPYQQKQDATYITMKDTHPHPSASAS